MMKPEKGFTLVELSIVLVIIGLLIGSILAAQSMISTVKVQRLVRDLQQYEISINNFKTNYNYYPGDAPSFNPPGTGNNILGNGPAGGVMCNGIYRNSEAYQIFAHLSEAGMISGNYFPWTPQQCGGTQRNNYSPDMAGIVAPYIQLNSNTATAVAQFAKSSWTQGNFIWWKSFQRKFLSSILFRW